MSIPTWLSYFIGIWASVYLADAALRAHPFTRQRYQALTARLGISINVLQARFFTSGFNNIFHFICGFDSIPWKLWFSCGVLFCATSMVLSLLLLTMLVYRTVVEKSVKSDTFVPMMPGLNLPISHLGFYIGTLLLCAFLHEAGHALAALRERVRLHGFGVFLFGLYPGAYVDLNTADLESLRPIGQLRIYCAGVWHNAVIALLSMLLFYAMPKLLYPAYHTGSAVGITYLRENSVVTGHRGLSVGDSITHVNSCPVTNQSEWFRCLEQAQNTPSGYCVSGLYLSNADTSVKAISSRSGLRRNLAALVPKATREKNSSAILTPPMDDCCSPDLASTHLCFTYTTTYKPGYGAAKYACLPARPVTERSSCMSSADCAPPTLLRHADTAASDLHRSMLCVIPSPPDNQTRLVRLAHTRKDIPALLFLGPLDDLLASVGVSDYVSRWPSVMSPRIPMALSLFCTYLFSLSGALVILNVVPCYALDGQYILKAFIDLCLAGSVSYRVREWVFRIMLCAGTLLILVNVLLTFRFYIWDDSAYMLSGST